MEFIYIDTIYYMLLPVFVLMALIITNKSTIDRVFSEKVLKKLNLEGSFLSRNSRNTLFFLAIILMIVALARPVLNRGEVKVEQKSFDLVIAIDISKSMYAFDVYPNRFEFAKKKAIEIVKLNKGQNIGVLVFADKSFVLCPMTSDYESLLYLLENLSMDSISTGGTDFEVAILGINNMLKGSNKKTAILISDGGDNDNFEDEINLIKNNNLTIYAMLVGTKNGSPMREKDEYIKDENGNIVISKANFKFKELAINSNGYFIEATLSNSDIFQIQTSLNKLEKTKKESQVFNDYKELFYYPLIFALILLFIALHSMPRRVSFMLLSLIFLQQESKAFLFDFKDIESAKKFYEQNEFEKAIKEYSKISQNKKSNESFYNLANSYYKNGEYKKAIENYSKIATNDKNLEALKDYNIANSYAKMGEFDKAIEFYEKTLKLKDDEDAKYNLEQIKKLKDEQNRQNRDDKNSEDKKNQKNKNSQNENEKQDKNQDKNKNENESDTSKNSEKSGKHEDKNQQDRQAEKNSENSNQQTKKDNQNSSKSEDEKESQISQQQFSSGDLNQTLNELEQKKWLQMLENQNAPILIYEMPTKKDKNEKSRW